MYKRRENYKPQVGVDGALLFGISMALKINKNEQKKERESYGPPKS
jgi:hypothetical protein